MRPNDKPFSWSPSALDSFEQCPRKHWHTRVAKTFVEAESEALKWGNRVHEVLDQWFRDRKEPPEEILRAGGKEARDLVARLETASTGARVQSETDYALDRSGKAVSWRSRDVWLRAKIDLIVWHADGRVATVVDWKTGKTAKEDQLAIYAMTLFDSHPELEACVTLFFMMPRRAIAQPKTFRRADFPETRAALLERVAKMEKAYQAGEAAHHPIPSGLCRGWCPVKTCHYNSNYSE